MTKNKLFNFLETIKWFGFRKLYWSVKRSYSWSKEALINKGIIYPSYQQSFINRSASRKIINTYDGDIGHNINFKQFFLGFGLIHYSFIRNWKPKNILCVGSRKGFIPAVLALACKDNNFGHVDFVDAGYDQDQSTKHWGGIGFWKKYDTKEHFGKIGVSDFITTYVMTTQEYADKFPKKHYQYIYIDGDHSYEGVKFDYSLFWPRLDKQCFMSFHDVVAHGYLDKGLFGVKKFWEELKTTHKIIFPFPKDSGLGIIQKD